MSFSPSRNRSSRPLVDAFELCLVAIGNLRCLRQASHEYSHNPANEGRFHCFELYSISGTSPDTNSVVGGPYSPISGLASRLQEITSACLSASPLAVRI